MTAPRRLFARFRNALRPTRLATVVAFATLWVLLVGEWSAGNLAAGVLVAVVVALVFPFEPVAVGHRVHPVALVSLGVHFTGLFLVSNYRMVQTVLRPTPARLRAGIIAVTLEPTSPLVTTLVANGISLTPGSLTVAADEEGTLCAHLVGLGSVEDARADIEDLHRRVIAAFEPRVAGSGR